jgi:hypothetical protein
LKKKIQYADMPNRLQSNFCPKIFRLHLLTVCPPPPPVGGGAILPDDIWGKM